MFPVYAFDLDVFIVNLGQGRPGFLIASATAFYQQFVVLQVFGGL
jgi:hypothetical protein